MKCKSVLKVVWHLKLSKKIIQNHSYRKHYELIAWCSFWCITCHGKLVHFLCLLVYNIRDQIVFFPIILYFLHAHKFIAHFVEHQNMKPTSKLVPAYLWRFYIVEVLDKMLWIIMKVWGTSWKYNQYKFIQQYDNLSSEKNIIGIYLFHVFLQPTQIIIFWWNYAHYKIISCFTPEKAKINKYNPKPLSNTKRVRLTLNKS
jgi:hypothetical protein